MWRRGEEEMSIEIEGERRRVREEGKRIKGEVTRRRGYDERRRGREVEWWIAGKE